MFKRIDHVELITDEPDRTVAFYTDTLGFKVKSRARVGSPGAALDIVYVELGGTTVEVITHRDAKPAPAPQGLHLGYNLIALEVEDMDRALDYLKGKGVPVVWGPVKLAHSARAEITDPNGYHIELRHWF